MTIEEKIGQMNQLDPSYDAAPKEAMIRQGLVGSVFNIVDAHEYNRLKRQQHIAYMLLAIAAALFAGGIAGLFAMRNRLLPR